MEMSVVVTDNPSALVLTIVAMPNHEATKQPTTHTPKRMVVDMFNRIKNRAHFKCQNFAKHRFPCVEKAKLNVVEPSAADSE
jgi:hypothetical protein